MWRVRELFKPDIDMDSLLKKTEKLELVLGNWICIFIVALQWYNYTE